MIVSQITAFAIVYSHKMPQKLTTTACFIQEESSGGKQFRKHVSCFYAQGGNVGVLSLK